MDNKNYIEGDKIINTTWFGRVDVFQIVDEFPGGYSVWNIGCQNFLFLAIFRLQDLTANIA